MKLFLSSMAISKEQAPAFIQLVGKEAGNIKLALIENASDVYEDDSTDWVNVNREAIESHGFDVEVIDLRDYKDNTQALQQKLSAKDVIWLGGGNTYYLRWLLRSTGADQVIVDLVKAGKVYGGGSAGAIVAGPTIDHFQKADNPDDAPEVVLDGLHLTEIVVVPHVGNAHYGLIMENAKKSLEQDGHDVIAIDDSQAVVIDGNSVKVIPGEK